MNATPSDLRGPRGAYGPRGRRVRMAAVGALSAALLAAGAAGTFASAAASPKPSPSASASASTSTATVTLTATPTTVKAGGKVTFTGRTKGVPIGAKVVLQHKYGTKWTTLHASTTVKQGSSYSLDNTFRDKGKEQLRVMVGDAVSPTVTVTVN
ncbi:hypothetical protein OHS33_02095 [Streptomyces sp. NBC_00536]|uniref:hypothetical protein n=1 Tax=Streptomyces sp. NBC_00536 TaxID=2975769 RepID=UPI002E81672F|nr:hypothetical protein [Streptomyces sp. NBC_00536]WUC77245.1 hypothetical protein OHS33_02095 [Streptomyces sp. NBC_00536]